MKTPSFSYMGGKARLRKRLIEYFPKSGNRYIEPFCGAGNMFFLAKQQLNFNRWMLNDKYCQLMSSIRLVDVAKLPKEVNKELFNELRLAANMNDCVALVLEPRITFGGKGYSSGFCGPQEINGSHVVYNRERYTDLLNKAKCLLEDVCLFSFDYLSLTSVFENLNEEDFIYMDPPYYNTKPTYPNINHLEFCKLFNSLSDVGIRLAVSGYDNELYQKELHFKNKYIFIRNSELKSSYTRKAQPVTECLWTSY